MDDELMRRAFYAVKTDYTAVFYVVEEIQVSGANPIGRRLRFKTVTELFGEKVVERLRAACDDLAEASRCLVAGRNKACVFHLMRAIEVGVLKIAKLLGIKDAKPSWGSILSQLERVVLRTRYEERFPDLNKHIGFLEAILPEMQAIQRAWRNKVSHVEDKILPEGEYTDEIAYNIMQATKVFICQIALDLPEGL
jgi:hypothetical protein